MPSMRGDVARIYFYMHDQYSLKMSKPQKQKQLFDAWSRNDPVVKDSWECERNKRIKGIQGNGNKYVEVWC